MSNKVEIEKPNIFPNEIISGLTLRNLDNFPPNGFSISKAQIYSSDEIYNFRHLLAREIGIDCQNLIFTHQTHSDKIAIVDNNEKNDIEADGMITNQTGLGIVLSLADCCGVVMYDKNHQVISAVHVGWRGARLKIVSKAIAIMIEKFNSDPNGTLVYISPCAGRSDYEVREDVAQYFPNHITKISEDKYLLDLGKAILDEIISNRIPIENIEYANKSTISNTMYHSFRRDKEKSGRMGLFIAMKIALS